MLSAKNEQQMLMVMTLVVVLMGIVALSSLDQEKFYLQSDLGSSPVRSPAALPEAESPNMASPDTARVDLKVNCDSPTPNYRTSESAVQLRALSCRPILGMKEIQLRNLTNGFTATVFPIDDRNFATDFVKLESGLNEISIDFKTLEGLVVTEKISLNKAEN